MRRFVNVKLNLDSSLIHRRPKLNFKNTYLGDFKVNMRAANDINTDVSGDVNVFALLRTMEHLNEKLGKPLEVPASAQPYKRESSFWRRRPGRILKNSAFWKTITSVYSWVEGSWTYFFGQKPGTDKIYSVVSPWVPGYPNGRSAHDYWLDGLGPAFSEIDSAEYNAHIQQERIDAGDNTIDITIHHGNDQNQNGDQNGGGTSDGENQNHNPSTGGASTTTGGNTPSGGEEKSVMDKWNALDTIWQILIVGSLVLVLILSVVGCYCCCKSDEEVVMQPQNNYPIVGHVGYRNGQHRSRGPRSRGRSRH